MRRFLDSMAERATDGTARMGEAFEQFRQTRLYVQVILSLVIVGTVLLVNALPIGPLARAQSAFRWMVSHDADLRGGWEQLDSWATSHGGWKGAARHAWKRAVDTMEPATQWLPSIAGEEGNGAAVEGDDPLPETAPAPSAGVPPAETGTFQTEAPPPVQLESRGGKVLPVDGDVLYGFGWRHFGGTDELHEGIDLMAEAGAEVRAISAGKVVRVIARDPKWGGVVEIEHGDYIAVYAGVDFIRVEEGGQVQAGEPFAVIAASPAEAEKSIGAHLHLEIRAKSTGLSIDPANYLSPPGTGT